MVIGTPLLVRTKEYKHQDPHCTQKFITNINQNLPGQDEVVYMPLVNTFNNLVECPSEEGNPTHMLNTSKINTLFFLHENLAIVVWQNEKYFLVSIGQ